MIWNNPIFGTSITLSAGIFSFLAFTGTAEAATYLVATEDTGYGAVCNDLDNCTLIDAILAANANPGADTIVITGPWNIIYSNAYNGTYNALPVISDHLTIEGYGAEVSRDDASTEKFRLFETQNGVKFTIKDMVIRDGDLTGIGGGNGGCLLTRGPTTIQGTIVDGCAAERLGGGLYSSPQANGFQSPVVRIQESSFRSNHSGSQGGGISIHGNFYPFGSAMVKIEDSALVLNSSSYAGGGLELAGKLHVDVNNTTIGDNAAINTGGGGVVTNVPAPYTVKFTNVTVTGNYGPEAGGIRNANPNPFTIINSIVADNNDLVPNTDDSIFGAVTSGTHNVFIAGEVVPAAGDLPVTNFYQLSGISGVGLGIPGYEHYNIDDSASPAINGGDINLCASDDQHDVARDDGTCDIGSVEYLP